jgi:hypothetical protein
MRSESSEQTIFETLGRKDASPVARVAEPCRPTWEEACASRLASLPQTFRFSRRIGQLNLKLPVLGSPEIRCMWQPELMMLQWPVLGILIANLTGGSPECHTE